VDNLCHSAFRDTNTRGDGGKGEALTAKLLDRLAVNWSGRPAEPDAAMPRPAHTGADALGVSGDGNGMAAGGAEHSLPAGGVISGSHDEVLSLAVGLSPNGSEMAGRGHSAGRDARRRSAQREGA
jgi:hypothetical protein